MKSLILCFLICSLTACSGGAPVNTNNTTPAGAQSNPYSLTKISQRTQSFDCSGNLLTDQVQILQDWTQQLSIPYPDSQHAYFLDVTSATTNESGPTINNNFTIDCGNGALALWVNNGDNVINYSFSYCPQFITDPKTGSQTCATALTVQQSGKFHIYVSCTEQTKDGINIVKPDPTTCPAK